MRSEHLPVAAVFALTFVFLALLTHDNVFLAGNDASRFAQIEALVDHGEAQIDHSRYGWTVDRVTIDGRDYSNKPPLLAIIGAGVYFLIETVFGLTFARHEAATVYILTLVLAGVPTAWLVARFYAALGVYRDIPGLVRGLTTLALAAGTILTSFSVTLNNHTIAAALLFAMCHDAWSGRGLPAGIWIALAFCIDPVPAAVFAPIAGALLWEASGKPALRSFLYGMGSGAAIFTAVNWWIVGSPFPPKMAAGAADQASGFASGIGGVLLPDHWTYPLECLVGWHGFFSVSPVLLFAAAGLVRAAGTGQPLPRRWCRLLLLGCTVMIAGHVLLAGSYGGWSYGFRYLIPIVPILLFFTPRAVGPNRVGPFAAVLAVSILFALIGAYHPWPPGYEQEARKDPVASVVTNPIGANLSGWARQRFPGSALADRLARTFISPDERVRERYLYLFYRSRGDDPNHPPPRGLRPSPQP